MTKNKVVQEKVLHSGKWMDSVELTYHDAAGEVRQWECLHRKNRASAAVIIPKLVPSGDYILIKQYRPPIDQFVIEFPAGLIDPGETAEQTAHRELKEETGYEGKILRISPPLYSSPGILSEHCVLVEMEIDAALPINQNPKAVNEADEFIEVFVLPKNEIVAFIQQEVSNGAALDVKLYSFFKELFLSE